MLGRSDESIRRMCERRIFPNAERYGVGGHWRIPRADVEALRESTRPQKRARQA